MFCSQDTYSRGIVEITAGICKDAIITQNRGTSEFSPYNCTDIHLPYILQQSSLEKLRVVSWFCSQGQISQTLVVLGHWVLN